ncbi:PX domain containing protein [Pyrenophora tritici-repentis]|uniref:PX domain containing protein n=2 Tax=Pyrenophora tritici-repentis TaxID=45151 RepID=A0A922NNE4_9PLEO|nr:PX domain containing protein [Pyrenophora tritici-repentis]
MPSLKISIPTTQEQTPETGKPYTSYTVKIEHAFPRAATTVSKRYSDFTALDASLRSEVQSAPPAPLPPKSWLGGFLGLGSTASSPEAVEKRRQGLEAYLRAIESSEDGRWRVSKAYKTFLGIGDSNGANGKKATREEAGSQFGRDRVRDSADWLDKHSELKSNLQDARRWLTRREQATAATAQHEAAANAKKSLVRAGTLISALDEGLSRLGGAKTDDWSSEKLGEGEIRRRRDMISGLRKERDGLESVLNSMAVKAAISGSGSSATPSTSSAAVTESQKAGLFKGAASAKPSGRRVLGAPAQETDRTRELDNDGVLQLQQQIIREQDEDLVDLATVVRRMKEMGVQINAELVEQNALMGLFEEDVERVDGKIKIAKKRVDKIRTYSNSWYHLAMPCQSYPACHVSFSWQPITPRRTFYWMFLIVSTFALIHFWHMGSDAQYLRMRPTDSLQSNLNSNSTADGGQPTPDDRQPKIDHEQSNHEPSTTDYGIPRLLWYKLGPMGLIPDTKKWTDSCINSNPGWKATFMTDEAADEYVKKAYVMRPDVVENYLGLSIPILKADMLRYLLLFDQGGVYSDLDVSCEGVPIDEWVPEAFRPNTSLVVGWEFDMGFEDNIMLEFESWTIMAKPHSPHLLQVIDDMVDAIEDVMEKHKVPVEKISLDMIGDVVDFSGPRRLTYGILKSLKRQLNRDIDGKEIRKIYQPKLLGDVLIMPGYSFAATQNSYQPGDELKMPPKLVQHHYAGTWKNKNGGETLPEKTNA